MCVSVPYMNFTTIALYMTHDVCNDKPNYKISMPKRKQQEMVFCC